MITEEPVSADDGRYSPSAPPAVRDANISASASGQSSAGLGLPAASAVDQLSVGAGFGTSSALAVGQLPVGAGFGTSSASVSGQPVGTGVGFRPASHLLPGPLAGQHGRGLPRSSGGSGSAGQLERSYLRLCPGTFCSIQMFKSF